MYKLIEYIKKSTFIGQYVELYDTPSDDSFIASGISLLRTEYPLLDSIYPSNNFAETVLLTDNSDVSGTQGFRHKFLKVYKSGNIIVISGVCEFISQSSWTRISFDNGATWNLWNSAYSGSVSSSDFTTQLRTVVCDGHGKWMSHVSDTTTISTDNAATFSNAGISGNAFYLLTGAGTDSLTSIACEYTILHTIWALRNGYTAVTAISIDDGVTWSSASVVYGELFTFKNKIRTVYNAFNGNTVVGIYDYDTNTWDYRIPSNSEGMLDYTYNNDLFVYLTNTGRIIYSTDFGNFDGTFIGNYEWDSINCTETHLIFTVSSTGQSGVLAIADIGIKLPTLTVDVFYGYPLNAYYMGNNVFWSGMKSMFTADTWGINKFKFQLHNPMIDIPADGNKFVRIK